MSDDYRKAYQELLKENTKLNASVNYWRGLAMNAATRELSLNLDLTRMHNNHVVKIKKAILETVKDKSVASDLLRFVDESQPLKVQSRA